MQYFFMKNLSQEQNTACFHIGFRLYLRGVEMERKAQRKRNEREKKGGGHMYILRKYYIYT